MDEYTLDELSARTGFDRRVIRSFIEQGLLRGPDTLGRYARYSQAHLIRLHAIKAMREIRGMQLAEIRTSLMVLTDEEVQTMALLDCPNLAIDKPEGSALDYIRSIRSSNSFATYESSPVQFMPVYHPPGEKARVVENLDKSQTGVANPGYSSEEIFVMEPIAPSPLLDWSSAVLTPPATSLPIPPVSPAVSVAPATSVPTPPVSPAVSVAPATSVPTPPVSPAVSVAPATLVPTPPVSPAVSVAPASSVPTPPVSPAVFVAPTSVPTQSVSPAESVPPTTPTSSVSPTVWVPSAAPTDPVDSSGAGFGLTASQSPIDGTQENLNRESLASQTSSYSRLRSAEQTFSTTAAAGNTPFDHLLQELLKIVDGSRGRKQARGAVWYRVSITPDIELSVKGVSSPEQQGRLERIADCLREILLGFNS